MSLSACLRSWMVLPVVGALLGAPAPPLARCDGGGGQVRRAADMPRQPESPQRCHDSEAPPASMTGCSDRVAGIMPFTSRTRTDLPSAPLALAAAPVDPALSDEAAQGAIERTVLLTRHRPLFTLFSALLL